MKTLIASFIIVIAFASCSQTYRVKQVDASIVKLVDMDNGFHIGDTILYKDKGLAYGERLVILNQVH